MVGFKAEPPMPGMSPGTIMVVKDDVQLIDVHISPTWFAKPGDIGVKKEIGLKSRVAALKLTKKKCLWLPR